MYAVQRPHKDSEACSGRKTKRNNTVDFDSSVKEDNIMKHDAPIPKKKKIKQTKRRKIESAKSDPAGVVNSYLLFWTGLRGPIACSLLGGDVTTQNSGYRDTRLCSSDVLVY